ncbi:MAG: ATP-binding protein [Saprospiraceae bacterium]
MNQPFIGREQEQSILMKAFHSGEPEMVAVLGRRRVGKTFLVRKVYAGLIDFEMTGIQHGETSEQLQHFSDRLNYHAKPLLPFKVPVNWQEAFQMLITYLEKQADTKKAIVFLDEFPWIAGQQSDFLKAFGLFWNSWASQNNIVVVICGSAASWMITHVVRDKGGLHNRITRRIHLQPFSLWETELFLQSRGVQLDRYHILQLYMALGGVPQYLKEVEGGKTATQNIDQICFSANGLLKEEFSQLYPALFDHADNHLRVIRALASSWKGLSRQEILQLTSMGDGGNATRVLEELVNSGFITPYYPFGKKKKGLIYRLTDEYSLFYLKFIEDKRSEGNGTWERLSQTQTWKSWSGYAFESICLKHIPQIKKALGISGIYSESSAYYLQHSEFGQGIQIDLLIDRADHAINLVEIKFYQGPYVIHKSQADSLRMKATIFKAATGTTKQLFITLLTTFPLHPNEHSLSVVDRALDMDCLFAPLDVY